MENPTQDIRWQEVQRLFDEVIDLDPGARAIHLERVCGDDAWLRREVLSLISAFDGAGDFLGLREGRDGSAASPARSVPAGVQEGAMVGSYQIIREIGRGGMGEVYLARDLKLGRLAALKFLPPHLNADEGARARLFAEARAAAALDHPNVATVYDIGEAERGRFFVAMAYCEGETLKERISRGSLSTEEVLSIATQVASGLAAAHRKGIVHRDIKPSNIIIPADGPLKVVDFGLAKRTGQDLTRTGYTLGTLAYMSPEQIRAEGVDHRTDLWSLGVVLYEMLAAGRSPFLREHDAATMYAVLYEEPQPLRDVRSDVPDTLAAVVEAALAKERERRYQRAEDLLEHLDGAERQGTPAVWPTNLPAPPTELIGRREELEAIERLVREGVRLVTLTGTGGTGKTRLGVRAAAELASLFRGAMFFVSLAPITSPSLVATATARVLGVREMGGRPVRESLIEKLKSVRTLLILDNFEHVVEAAEFVADLLAGCSGLTILVTSRTPLRVQGEHEFLVPPLGVPPKQDFMSTERLSGSESVALFTARARAVRPGFALTDENAATVAEICVRLEGLPLAIELAAVRVKVLPPRAILARLGRRLDLLSDGSRDRPARHRTLREAIAWSYGLLGGGDQQLFRRLGVFAGGFTLEAAEAVCYDHEENGFDVLSGLTSLVDHSLVRQEEQADGEPRFFMLETIREYALDMLAGNGEEPRMRQAHLDFFVQLVETAEPHLRGQDQARWLNQLEAEHNNVRSAFEFAMATDPTAAARITASFWRFYAARGFISEGYERMAQVLAHEGAEPPAVLRVRVLAGASILAMYLGLLGAAVSMLEEALFHLRSSAGDARAAEVMNHLCWIRVMRGEYAAARDVAAKALQIHRKFGNDGGMGTAFNNLAFLAATQGRFAEAASHYEESMAAYERGGDVRGLTRSQTGLGLVRHFQGRFREAEELQMKAVSGTEAVGDALASTLCRQRLALTRYEQGEPAGVVAPLFQANLAYFRDVGQRLVTFETYAFIEHVLADTDDVGNLYDHCTTHLERALQFGMKSGIARAYCNLGYVHARRGERSDAVRQYRESLRLQLDLEEYPGILLCLEGLARVALDLKETECAARLLGAARQIREAFEVPALPHDRARLDAMIRALREALGEEALAESMSAGASMTFREAMEYALGMERLLHATPG